MLSKSWAEALRKANEHRTKKRFLIAQQVNGDWYYLAMFKQGTAQTLNFDEKKLNINPLTGVRVWTNSETNGFDFQNEQVARENIMRLFGLDGHKTYKVVAGADDSAPKFHGRPV